MKNRIKIILFCAAAAVSTLILAGCSFPGVSQNRKLTVDEDETFEKESTAAAEIADDLSLYEGFGDEVKTVYLTVGRGNAEDGTGYSWSEVNSAAENDDFWEGKEYLCEAVLQFGDETAPLPGEFGYGALTANATVRLQGKNAATRQQKSYRVSIKDGSGNVNGIKTLVFSKEFSDPLRFTNKLCFDLMQGIPGMMSTRTSFVHLYVKDKSDTDDTLFVDYGLYTMIEPINKTYFKNRNLPKNGLIYKAENFDFGRHSDVITQATDSSYDEGEFEKLLEIKGDTDHTNLITVLDAVNDENVSIYETVKEYFDEDNIYDYLAFGLLTGNKDACLDNYYLYNPVGTGKFYFISWNNGGALDEDYENMTSSSDPEFWKKGIFLFSDNVLFSRILKDEKCREKLSEHVDNLYENYLTKEKVAEKASDLKEMVKGRIYSLPDLTFARVDEETYDSIAAGLSDQAERNFYSFYETLELPWPFHIKEPEGNGGKITINWESAFLYGGEASYDVVVDDAWDFQSPIINEKGMKGTSLDIGSLSEGQYFVKITAVSGAGETAAREYYNTEKKTMVEGTLCFYVLADGSARALYMYDEG